MRFGNLGAMVRDSGQYAALWAKFGWRAQAPFARTLGRAAAVFAVLLAIGAGCAAPQPAPPLTGASQGTIATGAVVTAIAAGAVWAAGGGCRLQGCPYGSYCNQKTGFCDVRRCDQGCPDGTVCNEGLGRCQASPPPVVPNDFLPTDDARLPPGTN